MSSFEHDNRMPDYFKENWEGKWSIFSWMEFVCAIPQVLFMVTTVKDNGLPNAAFQSWAGFTGEGDDFFIIMSGVMKHTHALANIRRGKEFCVNFLNVSHLEKCWRSIKEHDLNTDEIASSGFTIEPSASITPPRIAESFLKLECELQWEKELVPGGRNVTICGKTRYISVSDAFAKANTNDKYGMENYMLHLHNPIDPFTGDYLGGGVGIIKKVVDM